MKNKSILAATALAAISATPIAANAQDTGITNTGEKASTSAQDLTADNLLNDERPAVRALLNAKLNGLVASGDNPSGEFQVVDYLVGWSSYGLVVKSPALREASFETDELKSLIGDQNLNEKIASGRATFRDLIQRVSEMGLDQNGGAVRMGKDGIALI